MKSWYENWPNLTSNFKFSQGLRKLIYTINAIEAFNRQLRKVSKPRSVFPTGDSLFKRLYLVLRRNRQGGGRTGAGSMPTPS